MTRLRFRTIAFDLDGTLADTAPDLTAALNHALGLMGRPSVPAGDVRHMVGHGARALLQKGLAATGGVSEGLVDRGFPLFMAHYEAHIADGSRPFPGVEAALDRLAADGIALAVCTNKSERLARLFVSAMGWDGRFAAIVGGDTLTTRKPAPEMVAQAIARAGGGPGAMVGDSISDTDAARAAGVPCVALTFGFSDRPADQLGADRLIDHWDALIPALATL